MDSELTDSRRLSEARKGQRDSARVERDSARVERDSARVERDDFRTQADGLEKDKVIQEQFIATLSHDLRNPIGAIKMAVQLIRDAPGTDLAKEMTDLIDRNADQAGDLITQLLDAHLIRSGAQIPISIERCDVLTILKKCIQSLAPENQKNIELKSNQVEEILGFWDPRALERAFSNLMSNAIKFSGRDKKIEICATTESEITTISFQNSGEVISLADQLRIFDSQFRAQQTKNNGKMGWGLGLTLVRGIAEAHGGKIEVTSDKTDGTIFTLKLPTQPQT